MRRHGATVNLGAGAGAADPFGYVKDDAGEAILVNPDLLAVGDLTKLAARRKASNQRCACGERMKASPDVGKVGGEVGDDCAAKEGSADELGHRA